MKTRIALAQINVTVGDFAGNVAKIVAAARSAHNDGAKLLIAPELALSGYPPEDLLLRPAFYTASAAALADLAAQLKPFTGLHVIVGHPLRDVAHGHGNANAPIERGVPPVDTFNAASLIVDGEVKGTYRKQDLPNTEVFDEKRYFASDPQPFVFELDGVKYGVVICEDAWHASAAQMAKAAGAQVVLIPNGSPYHLNKEAVRFDILRARIRETGLPMVYVNMVGAQDELVFDGGSFVLDAQGELVAKMAQFEEATAIVEFDNGKPLPAAIAPEQSLEAQVYAALVMGVRDYINKNGFPGALIGLSGGVDSALVLAVACDALGADRVRAVMMPSRYTADISTTDAAEMARRVGVRYDEIAIAPMFDAFRSSLADEFAGRAEDATEENIQARIRGTLLMALSNKFGSIVLTTGNKSEMAVGYCNTIGQSKRISTRRVRDSWVSLGGMSWTRNGRFIANRRVQGGISAKTAS
jgi:NAD+ synthase (glutamine-hydrolysing)